MFALTRQPACEYAKLREKLRYLPGFVLNNELLDCRQNFSHGGWRDQGGVVLDSVVVRCCISGSTTRVENRRERRQLCFDATECLVPIQSHRNGLPGQYTCRQQGCIHFLTASESRSPFRPIPVRFCSRQREYGNTCSARQSTSTARHGGTRVSGGRVFHAKMKLPLFVSCTKKIPLPDSAFRGTYLKRDV
jgi:hypothetical protein